MFVLFHALQFHRFRDRRSLLLKNYIGFASLTTLYVQGLARRILTATFRAFHALLESPMKRETQPHQILKPAFKVQSGSD